MTKWRALLLTCTWLVALVSSGACGGASRHVGSEGQSTPSESGHELTSDAPGLDSVAGRRLTAAEEQAFAPLLSTAERIRGLRFLRGVPTRVQTPDEISEFVRSRTDSAELEQARVFYVAIGLLPPDLDIGRMLTGVMSEQIAGYFDPTREVMVARSTVVDRLSGGRASPESQMLLIHEFVHALQHQHFSLNTVLEQERSIDAQNALAALIEGDATLAMYGWLVSSQHLRLSALTRNHRALLDMRRQGMAAAQSAGPELGQAPAIVRAPLLSRYFDGMVFCGTLHGHGGYRWIDEVFADPPASTEQILHPERMVAEEWAPRDRPIALEMPEFQELEAAGLTRLAQDTLGELELSIYLAQGSSEDRNHAAADGWGGDVLRVYTRDGQRTAALWWILWDTESEAIEAEAAALGVAQRALGSIVIRRVGRALAIIHDLETELIAATMDDFEALAAAYPAN